ncbi:MAG: hypothetical protein AAGA17_15015 [Actinomycetota bacterium]
MRTATTDPIVPEWSTPDQPTATARQLALALARFEVAEVEAWRAELLDAVAELAAAAGTSWRFGTGDPTIALVRAAAVLAGHTPDVAGPRTAIVVAALGG